jgi:hypothetical protein
MTHAGPINYRFVLPPGWVHIPVDDEADDAVAHLARKAAARVEPSKRATAETFLREKLDEAVAQARASSGQDLYLPTEPVQGMPLPLSIVVGETRPPGKGVSFSAADALLSFASRSPDSRASAIDGELAVRSTSVIAATDEFPGSRRVTYLVCTPAPNPRLMLITAAILTIDVEGFPEIADSLEFLFDSMVATIRFERKAVPA